MAVRLPPLPRRLAAAPAKQAPAGKTPCERCRKIREAAKRLMGLR